MFPSQQARDTWLIAGYPYNVDDDLGSIWSSQVRRDFFACLGTLLQCFAVMFTSAGQLLIRNRVLVSKVRGPLLESLAV